MIIISSLVIGFLVSYFVMAYTCFGKVGATALLSFLATIITVLIIALASNYRVHNFIYEYRQVIFLVKTFSEGDDGRAGLSYKYFGGHDRKLLSYQAMNKSIFGFWIPDEIDTIQSVFRERIYDSSR